MQTAHLADESSARPWLIARTTPALFAALLSCSASLAQEATSAPANANRDAVVERSLAHMQQFEVRLTTSGTELVPLLDRPLLRFGDSARDNQNGSVWVFGKEGRPLALLELYQGTKATDYWIHAVTLTGDPRISLKATSGAMWRPQTIQIEPKAFMGVAPPAAGEGRRLRQMKELARRFTAHEFWDPDNSRFELRLLVQPIHRYRDAAAGLVDGTAFVLANGTNPEVVLLIEALGKTPDSARWHYSLARLGSAELHVELDGGEVWKRERTPGVAGQPTDPYWLFVTAADETE